MGWVTVATPLGRPLLKDSGPGVWSSVWAADRTSCPPRAPAMRGGRLERRPGWGLASSRDAPGTVATLGSLRGASPSRRARRSGAPGRSTRRSSSLSPSGVSRGAGLDAGSDDPWAQSHQQREQSATAQVRADLGAAGWGAPGGRGRGRSAAPLSGGGGRGRGAGASRCRRGRRGGASAEPVPDARRAPRPRAGDAERRGGRRDPAGRAEERAAALRRRSAGPPWASCTSCSCCSGRT
jgi:hypothetical protein